MVKAPRSPASRVTRGDIWLRTLDPTPGSEIQNTRPCVVISPPELHDRLRTILLAPMTTANRPAKWRVPIRFDGKDGLILLDQIRALDKLRLVRRLGASGRETLSVTLERLQEMFAEWLPMTAPVARHCPSDWSASAAARRKAGSGDAAPV